MRRGELCRRVTYRRSRWWSAAAGSRTNRRSSENLTRKAVRDGGVSAWNSGGVELAAVACGGTGNCGHAVSARVARTAANTRAGAAEVACGLFFRRADVVVDRA